MASDFSDQRNLSRKVQTARERSVQDKKMKNLIKKESCEV